MGWPALVAPDRSGLEHDLFVVTDGRPGHSFRVRFGSGRAPLIAAASLPAFYDGKSLALFGRRVLRRTVELPGGGTFHERRVRLTEEDGFGTGRWIHRHGLFQDLPANLGDECDATAGPCVWDHSSGLDLVSIVGDLRGMRSWSGGTQGVQTGAEVEYLIADRFGHPQDLIKLYPEQHRELIRLAYDEWYKIPEEIRSCYAFDYKSSFLRPSPGGLTWVMHGRAVNAACEGTSLPVEVPAPLPRHGVMDDSAWSGSGDVFHYGPPDVWVDTEGALQIRVGDVNLGLPGGGGQDPPLAALHWMREDAIGEAHLEAIQRAYTEVHDLVPISGEAEVAVDGKLGDWDGESLLYLDQLSNVSWQRHGARWEGPVDASLGIGVRAVEGGWVVATRILDDVVDTVPDGRQRALSVDHLEIWVLGQDGWIELAVLPGAEAGAAPVEVWALQPIGEQEEDPPETLLAAAGSVKAAWQPRAATKECAAGWDAEVLLPTGLARVVDGRIGLRVLFVDGDGADELLADLRLGNVAPLADAWVTLD